MSLLQGIQLLGLLLPLQNCFAFWRAERNARYVLRIVNCEHGGQRLSVAVRGGLFHLEATADGWKGVREEERNTVDLSAFWFDKTRKKKVRDDMESMTNDL